MAKIILYKKFSDAGQEKKVKPGKAIKNYYFFQNFNHVIFIANGKKVDENYIVQEKDVILIRWIPLYDGYSFGDWFMDVLTFGGHSMGKKAQIAADEAAEEARRTKDLLARSKDDIVNLPYIKGSSNQVATGRTQPFLIGTHLFTPYILNASKSGIYSKGYHTISGTDGEKQFLNRVYELGFISQVLKRVFISDVTIKNFSDTAPQNGVYTLPQSSFAGSDSFLEIRQGSSFLSSIFNQKIVEKEYSNELKLHDKDGGTGDYEPLFFTLEKNSMAADICIMFNGLMWYDSDGNKVSASRSICVAWSADYAELVARGNSDPDRNATWNTFSFDGALQPGEARNYFERTTNKQMRFKAHVDFSWSTVKNLSYPITIKLYAFGGNDVAGHDPKYFDEKKEKGSGYRQVYVEWVHSYTYDITRSKSSDAFVSEKIIEDDVLPYCTLLGLHLEATSSNADKTDSLQVITSGVARTLSKNQNNEYVLSSSRTVTSNPAAWYIEVLTSSTHKPSQFELSEIDLQSFGEWFTFCANKGFTVDKVLNEGAPKETVLQMIASCGRASIYRNIYGQMAVAIDTIKENAVAVLNEQNMISFSWEKKLERIPDGIKASYIDASQEYQDNTILVMYNGSVNPETRPANSIITDKKCDGRTNWQTAYLDALFEMKTTKLRRKTCTAEVGKEGIFFIPLSKFLVQHPSLKIGLGSAEIKSVIVQNSNIVGIELFEYITLDLTNDFNVIIQCVGTNPNDDDYCTPLTLAIYGYNGRTNELYFKNPVSASASVIPHSGDILSYGYGAQTVTSPMLLTEVSPTEKGYTLKLIDYDERVYDDTSTFPDYAPNLTQPQQNPATVPSTVPSVSYEDFYDAYQKVIINDERLPANISSLSAVAERDGVRFTVGYNASTLYDTLEKFVFQVRRVKNGITGDWESITVSGNFYTFDRNPVIDGYPEKIENGGYLDNWQFRVKALNIYGNLSENWYTQIIDVSHYLSWLPPVPVISTPRVSHRTVTLNFGQTPLIYGAVKFRVSIQRLDEYGLKDTWFKPDVISNPYESESAYKDLSASESFIKDGKTYYFHEGTTSFTQVLPLQGAAEELGFEFFDGTETSTAQVKVTDDGELEDLNVSIPAENSAAVDTSYYYRVWAVNAESNVISSNYAQVLVTAKATSVLDIVNNAIVENKIADEAVTVDKLHANCVTAEKLYSRNLTTVGAFVGSIYGAELDPDKFRLSTEYKANEVYYLFDNTTKKYIKADPQPTAITWQEDDYYIKNPGFGMPREDSNNYWKNLDSELPEFRIGNDRNAEFYEIDTGDNTTDAEFMHYVPEAREYDYNYKDGDGVEHSGVASLAPGIYFKIANFIVTAIASIIKGLFQVKSKASGNSFLSANPETTQKAGIPAETLRINGDVQIGNKSEGGAGNQSISGNQTVSGNQSIGGNQTVSGNQSIGGNQTVSGNQTIGSSSSAKNETIYGKLSIKNSSGTETASLLQDGSMSAKKMSITDIVVEKGVPFTHVVYFSSSIRNNLYQLITSLLENETYPRVYGEIVLPAAGYAYFYDSNGNQFQFNFTGLEITASQNACYFLGSGFWIAPSNPNTPFIWMMYNRATNILSLVCRTASGTSGIDLSGYNQTGLLFV